MNEKLILRLAQDLAKREHGEHYEGCESSHRELAAFCIESCAADRLYKACETMLDAFQLIPLPDDEDEYRGIAAARQNLINAMASADGGEVCRL